MDQPVPLRPAASIVIPLWNKAEYTRACLRRLAAGTPAGLYEVVLVDNGSTDATGELLAGLSGDVRILRNDRNLGFARACNQGAAVATGRYLVFLNNDTEPHPGWLEPLVEILDGEPDVGVVGSKLLFPNGLVQHAGVWLVADEEGREIHGSHRLSGAVADDPVAEERSDVQVVTGACLAIRREVFESLGGFDEGYWNGNEDVDLCLKVREAGYRVVYEPRSTLTHHESVSGPERFSRCGDNIRRLTERWRDRVVLDAIGENGLYRTAGRLRVSRAGTAAAAGVDEAPDRRTSDAVHVVGFLGPGGRPGRSMARVVDLLSAAGVPHHVSAYHRSWPQDSPPAYSVGGPGEGSRVVLVCSEPDNLAEFLVLRGPDFLADRYVIAAWSWPEAAVPEYGVDAWRLAHEFWVPSDALAASAAGVCAGSIVTLPPVPGPPSAVGAQIRAVTGTAGRLAFTATVELGTDAGPAHAGDDAALAMSAFTAAFPNGEDVSLLVGVAGGRHLPWRVDGLVARAGGDPRVAVLDLDSAGIDGEDLAAAGDCHVALLGARGLAPVASAAMQAGAPVVALSHPANPGILTPGCAYLVEPAVDEATVVSHTAAVLREVAADPVGRRARGRQAAGTLLRCRDGAVALVRARIARAGRFSDQLAAAGRR